MGVTSVDLFRSGNSTSARLNRVRTTGPDRDVDTRLDAAGAEWVVKNGKGVSTADSIDPAWTGHLWKLSAGHTYSNLLVVWNDDPGHWVWEPASDMLLSEYVDALTQSDLHFIKV